MGDTINDKVLWTAGKAEDFSGFSSVMGQNNTYGLWGNSTGFAGLMLVFGSDSSYGWVHLTIGTNCIIKMDSFAYQARANGIQKFNFNKSVDIYPNLTTGVFTIKSDSTEKQLVQIYDLTGKLMFAQTIFGNTTIDASSLSQGIYNVNFTSNESIVNKRLVIVR